MSGTGAAPQKLNAMAYFALLLLSILAGVGGILTLMPAAGATYENLFGYRSLCTFAPAASLFCFFVAGSSCVIRASFVKRKAMLGKPVVRKAPGIVVIFVLVLALASSGWFIAVDSQYQDGTTGATVAE